ncbi:MAG: hypothetical protein OZ921_09245 [Sorangiineae bacterium]|nr:hypothetical protein [Polyangiaceae bacterium]MEB2322688.1 hypothetical protein [Sorangiineae bacterium]
MTPLRPLIRALLLAVTGSALAVACSANGSGGSGGSGATSGSGNTGNSGSGGGAGSGGGLSEGGIEVDSGTDSAADATSDGPVVVNDAAIDAPLTCVDGGVSYQPGPQARRCAPPTDDECNGKTDLNAALPNGQYGNGFDDDCDGRVDEGCACAPGTAVGATKPCWLISSSQADASGSAVGWCAANSRGTEACTVLGTGEFAARVWSGECRGAQPPFASDVCANGDFDCDGAVGNSKTDDCACEDADVECPTAPLVTSPYPAPANLPLIDGSTWLKGADISKTANWKWTATGGDCDNVLPQPSFQLFNNQNAAGQAIAGVRQTGLGPAGNQTGLVTGPGAGVDWTLYPAFALSGDYLVKGEFDLSGKHYACTVKVQVRAPGIRAELCWSPMPNDLDLHFARLQGATGCTGPHGWFESCKASAGSDDCYYNSTTGCTGVENPGWGYATSPNPACKGWGSTRVGLASGACVNPRLDSDNIECNPKIRDPNNHGLGGQFGFCAAENINLDNPRNGDRFAIGTHAYSTTQAVHPHINVYCNGERRLSVGYDPVTSPSFPVMVEGSAAPGQTTYSPDFSGDFWVAATVEAVVTGTTMTDCVVLPVRSTNFKPAKDGSSDYCVDTNPKNAPTAANDARSWNFIPSGGYPTPSDKLCWH